MDNIVIRVENLSKLYHLGQTETERAGLTKRLRGGMLAPFRRQRGHSKSSSERELWALKDVSFEVKRGEALGIIGPNGAGKSTLLKLLSGLTAPTEGRITIRGRVGSMLEIGTGFNPELSGRENVFLNGVILGMKRREIEHKFDEIVAFSGVERFLDMPVKRYSSGMRVRLAFSVIAHLEPEILLIDEILSVGDAAFRRQSMTKMEELIQGGRTVLFVSHNEKAISDLCDWAMRMEEGRIVDRGASDEVVERYLERELGSEEPPRDHVRLDADPSKSMRLRSLSIQNDRGEQLSKFKRGDSLHVKVSYDVNQPVHGAHVVCFIRNRQGVNIVGTGDADCSPERLGERAVGHYAARFQLPTTFLKQDSYFITISLSEPHGVVFDRHEDVIGFEILELREDHVARQLGRRPSLLRLQLPWEYGKEPVASKREPGQGLANGGRHTP
jgi:lipopolysaccharide transport system ATP-binding protein